MVDFEIVNFCVKKIIESAKQHFQQYPAENKVRVFSDSGALEMMFVAQELQGMSELPWTVTQVTNESSVTFFWMEKK